MKSQQYNNNPRGFSLIEMAVVIAIIGILMTFGIRLASSFQNKGAFSATAERQKQIKDVLTAFLAREGRLPCPAAPGVAMTGDEDCTPANNPGLIPFQTLGIPKSSAMDGWDRYFTYAVWSGASTNCPASGDFVEVSPAENWTTNITHPISSSVKTFHDGANGCLMIEETGVDGDATNPNTNRRRAVALVISHGPNGFGGYTAKGEKIAFPVDDAADHPEKKNSIGNGASITTAFRTQPINLEGFDDIVLEISADDLLVPLKRDGTVVSKQQLDRDFLYTLFATKPELPPSTDCKIEYIDPEPLLSPVTVAPSAPPQSQVTLTSPQYGSILISNSRYCPGGQFTSISLVPNF